MQGALDIPVSFSQQDTRGGGDIRRQDMPFVSNRMDFSRVDAHGDVHAAAGRASRCRSGQRTLSGRNVGQSTTFAAGIMLPLPVLRPQRD